MKPVIGEFAKYHSDFKKRYKKGVLVTGGILGRTRIFPWQPTQTRMTA